MVLRTGTVNGSSESVEYPDSGRKYHREPGRRAA
jgi:hypothetical protein